MASKGAKLFQERAGIMKALAHPSRLLMVDELSRGPRCVCELTELVGADISTVSKHLSVLKKAGLVDCHRQGVKIFYRLRVPCVVDFFDCMEAVRCEGLRHRPSARACR